MDWRTVRRAVRQFFCQHRTIEGKRWVEWHPNGSPMVIGRGRCYDCGKAVPPPEIDSRELLRMLLSAKRPQPPGV